MRSLAVLLCTERWLLPLKIVPIAWFNNTNETEGPAIPSVINILDMEVSWCGQSDAQLRRTDFHLSISMMEFLSTLSFGSSIILPTRSTQRLYVCRYASGTEHGRVAYRHGPIVTISFPYVLNLPAGCFSPQTKHGLYGGSSQTRLMA